ncbi:agmatinase, partial [Zopfochytrium polystomum]
SLFPGDGEKQADSIFSGITTFASLPYQQCFTDDDVSYDIAIVGLPFDTATSYRPGARFGPGGIRQGSKRLVLYGGYNVPLQVNAFTEWATIVDCGDVAVTSYDNALAIKQMEFGHKSLLHKTPASADRLPAGSLGAKFPRLITLGGDHTIVLPILRSIASAYGPVSVIHFDSHIDTWKPSVFGGDKSEQAAYNHGTYFYHASQEGLIKKGASIHAGIRTTLSGPSDYDNDALCGFEILEARVIDEIGTKGIAKRIREVVGDNLVYLSIDIDSLDPAFAPATGTPETGGWSTRELRSILRDLEGLRFVGADVVEVAPAYDTNAELTTMAAADVIFEILGMMVKHPLK